MEARLDVLVVDDEPGAALATMLQLQEHLQVRAALSVPAAMRELRRRVPDVLVCGLGMESVEGQELFEIIAGHFPQLRRVLYSASPPSEWQALVERGLIQAVVTKPGTLRELLAAIDPRA